MEGEDIGYKIILTPKVYDLILLFVGLLALLNLGEVVGTNWVQTFTIIILSVYRVVLFIKIRGGGGAGVEEQDLLV